MTAREKYERLRDAQSLTDNEVRVRAGIEKATFYTWRKRQEKTPNATMGVSHMQRVATALGVTIDAVVGDPE